jgi:hypothetical protein
MTRNAQKARLKISFGQLCTDPVLVLTNLKKNLNLKNHKFQKQKKDLLGQLCTDPVLVFLTKIVTADLEGDFWIQIEILGFTLRFWILNEIFSCLKATL